MPSTTRPGHLPPVEDYLSLNCAVSTEPSSVVKVARVARARQLRSPPVLDELGARRVVPQRGGAGRGEFLNGVDRVTGFAGHLAGGEGRADGDDVGQLGGALEHAELQRDGGPPLTEFHTSGMSTGAKKPCECPRLDGVRARRGARRCRPCLSPSL